MKSLLKIFKVIALTGLIGLTIAFIYLAVGFTYFRVFEPLFRRVEPPGYVEYQLPKIPRLEVGIEMERTQFRVGEDITPTPYIVNRGQQAITLFSRGQLLSFRVYDAQNRVVAVRPVFRLVRVRASPWVLEPGKPFDEEWRQWYLDLPDERWQDRHTFTLEQPGRYRIVASAEICFDGDFAYPVRVYADPIWIEVVGGSK
ncbi:hypothetical protein M1N08_01635 [Dehalococcoidia bacterium]|nr:hypothetical protein [Dehalococcoidia bacterium]